MAYSSTAARLACLAALASLSACQPAQDNATAPAAASAANTSSKKGLAAVAGIDGTLLRGVNGIQVRLRVVGAWSPSHCALVRIENTHPVSTAQQWQVVLDLGRTRLSHSSGASVSGTEGFVTLSPLLGGGAIAPGTAREIPFCVTAPVGERPPVLVRVSSELPRVSADPLEVGQWRVVARSTRHTLEATPAATLAGNLYTAGEHQHWRFRAQPGGYSLRLESNGQCLQATAGSVQPAGCGADGQLWTLDTLRVRSEDRPAVFRLRQNGSCLRLNGTQAASIAACDSAADLYIEPTGTGERLHAAEYELRSLLMIKPGTEVQQPYMRATIPADIQAAAQTAFNQHLAVWFERLTDGRIKWVGESQVVSPMTAVVQEGGNYLPAASTMQQDVRTWLPMGKYDSAAVFYASGTDAGGQPVPGGWGWGPGISDASNRTMWVTVNGGATPAADWISWNNEPMEVFIHEPMHGLDGFFSERGVPLPDGWLHAAESNMYTRDQNGYAHWYRDYLLGQVIAADDTYRGYGPRAFRTGTPRAAAAAMLQRTVVFMYGPTASGQDMFLRGGIDHAAAQTLLGKTCTAANLQCAIPISHRNLRNATTAPWKLGDEWLDWYGREASQSLVSPGHGLAEGTAADWTTNNWTFGNPVRTVAVDGYGLEPLNQFGSHYWMLDVTMDCSKAYLDPRDGQTRWFEVKSFISNGPGWENNVVQVDRPYVSGNHFAKCGKINVFERGSSAVRYFPL